MRFVRNLMLLLFMLAGVRGPSVMWAAEPLDALRYQDPPLEVTRRVTVFSPRLKTLWIWALGQDEADLRRQAADAIARAHQAGMPGLEETVAPLVAALEADDAHPLVRLSAARALDVLDAREAAPALSQQLARNGLDFARRVEPLLARWKPAEPLLSQWQARLNDEGAMPALRRLAVECLGIAGVESAVPELAAVAREVRNPPEFRLLAARAAGPMAGDEAVTWSRELIERSAPAAGSSGKGEAAPSAPAAVDRLVAATLLASAESQAALELLERLAADPLPAVAAVALERLLQTSPERVVRQGDTLLTSRDAQVRLLTVRGLATEPSPGQIQRLSSVLADPHPGVRRLARETLLAMGGRPELTAAVAAVVDDHLQRDDWRGLEQAALLAAQLPHSPAADPLVRRLEHPRPEVMLASAWALRVLAVADTLPRVLAYAQRETQLLDGAAADPPSDPRRREAVPEQLPALFELLGSQRYEAAEPLLRRYVPKNPNYGYEARAAAVWSLGLLYEDRTPPDLPRQLAQRLADLSPVDSEDDRVRRVSAVSLGRMRAEAERETLQQFRDMEGDGTPVGRACGWALARLGGPPLEDPGERRVLQSGWFLEPLLRPDELPKSPDASVP